ncbi:putative IMP dehydrogenase/GMP reductase, partial [Trifolium medium]|nr:putative IMP dehydrogenase/GMP reductase [Trifolium medium]
MNRFSIAQAFSDYLTDNYVTEEMRGPRALNGFDTDTGYILWFYQVSHPKILPPIEGNPPRPANVEVLIAEENANDKCDVFEICRT